MIYVKKMLAVFMASVLLFAAGCTQTAKNPLGAEEPDEWGITLSAEDVTPTDMTLVCTQNGGRYEGELETGSPFVLEQFVEGEWLPVGTKPGLEWAWTMEGWIIKPNAQTKWRVNWEWLYGCLEPGSYRMAKRITDSRGPGEYTERTYYAEFGIVD